MPDQVHRKRVRLEGFDYREQTAYFVTMCTRHRAALFGSVAAESLRLSGGGELIAWVWAEMPLVYPGVSLDEYVVMPDHVHGVVVLSEPAGAQPGLSLIQLIQRYKSLTTREYRSGMARFGWPPFSGRLWQRSYYDHVVRNDEDLDRVRKYIRDNPGALIRGTRAKAVEATANPSPANWRLA